MKLKPFDIFLILFFLCFVTISIFLLISLKEEGSKCLSSPLNYGIGKIQDSLNAPVRCLCSVQIKGYSPFFVTNNATFPLN